jgi:hypothetical protein
MKRIGTIATVLLLVLLTACTTETLTHTSGMNLSLQTTYRGQIFTTPGLIKDSLGNHIQLEVVRTYISDITLFPKDGGEPVVLPGIYLFDQGEGNPDRIIKDIPIGDYEAFSVSIAIDSLTNATTLPADYPDDHPLGIGANMHWDWNTGYIFFKYEGRMDTTFNDVFDHFFIYHVGLDENARTKTFNKNLKISYSTVPSIDLLINLDKIFSPSGINAREENSTHTMNDPVLAAKMADIQLNALELDSP